MPHATKEVFLASLECPTKAWLFRNSEGTRALSEAERLRMDEGREVGAKAREAIPGGVFPAPLGSTSAAERTASLIADGSVEVVYEATFEVGGLVAKADILRRQPTGWTIIEVKMSSNEKPELVHDLAYTVMVARRAGLLVSRAVLVLVSKEYRLGLLPNEFFVEVDRTAEVNALVPQFVAHWDRVSGMVLRAEKPEPALIFACRSCQYYEVDCLGKGLENPLFDLPRLSQSKFEKLKALGVHSIGDIPASFDLTDNQERVRNAVASGEPWQSPDLATALDQVTWPAFFLDFETTSTAQPLFENVAPFEQLPTQYSIHLYEDAETELGHKEFLADHRVDERGRLAARLVADLEGSGSIVVYSSFEKRIINYLRALFPELANQLAGFIERLFDLEALIKGNCYHPEFRGMSSIKRTLPALVPGMGYDSLSIGSGEDASALFARMARGERSWSECGKMRNGLLKYCGQDTLAMVRLVQALRRLC